MNLQPIHWAVVFFGCGLSFLSADDREVWHATYDGGFREADVASALTLDAVGNVIVTGASSIGGGRDSGWATVRYDPNGRTVWDARLDSESGSGEMAARDIGVDGKGDVYVVGWIAGPPNSYGVVKYGADGRKLWVARYGGVGAESNSACCLALSEEGHVYVTGHSTDVSPDYVTLKYSSDGELLWTARYDGPAGGADYVADLALDANGGIYVTGRSEGPSIDYATVKYSPEGEELWVRTYDGPGGADDVAIGLAVDASGSIYVAGTSTDLDDDYAILKYDPVGVHLWTVRYDGGGSDTARAVVCDIDESVYVTGSSERESVDYMTLKFNASGRKVWSAGYDGLRSGFDRASDIALGTDGRVYVTGTESSGMKSSDCATVCYDERGQQLWIARYDGPAGGPDEAHAIAIDAASGSVYIAGKSAGSGLDYVVAKYAAILWRRGDVNIDGATNLKDALSILRHLFHGEGDLPCAKSADTNDDASVSIADVVFLLSYLFDSGARIPEPSTECGFDPFDDGLSCASFEICS